LELWVPGTIDGNRPETPTLPRDTSQTQTSRPNDSQTVFISRPAWTRSNETIGTSSKQYLLRVATAIRYCGAAACLDTHRLGAGLQACRTAITIITITITMDGLSIIREHGKGVSCIQRSSYLSPWMTAFLLTRKHSHRRGHPAGHPK